MLRDDKPAKAAEALESLTAHYPATRWSQQALLDLMYAYHEAEDPAMVVATADRFLRLYPQHPRVDYALYMRGVANFAPDRGILQNYIATNKALRDPGDAKKSF